MSRLVALIPVLLLMLSACADSTRRPIVTTGDTPEQLRARAEAAKLNAQAEAVQYEADAQVAQRQIVQATQAAVQATQESIAKATQAVLNVTATAQRISADATATDRARPTSTPTPEPTSTSTPVPTSTAMPAPSSTIAPPTVAPEPTLARPSGDVPEDSMILPLWALWTIGGLIVAMGLVLIYLVYSTDKKPKENTQKQEEQP